MRRRPCQQDHFNQRRRTQSFPRTRRCPSAPGPTYRVPGAGSSLLVAVRQAAADYPLGRLAGDQAAVGAGRDHGTHSSTGGARGRMHGNAAPRSLRNYGQARWTTSEYASLYLNMREGNVLNSGTTARMAAADLGDNSAARRAQAARRRPRRAGRLVLGVFWLAIRTSLRGWSCRPRLLSAARFCSRRADVMCGHSRAGARVLSR